MDLIHIKRIISPRQPRHASDDSDQSPHDPPQHEPPQQEPPMEQPTLTCPDGNRYTVASTIAYGEMQYETACPGVILFGLLTLLILWRLLHHIRAHSRKRRILFHILLLLATLLEGSNSLMLSAAPVAFCFVYKHQHYTWLAHMLSISLQFLALMFTINNWATILLSSPYSFTIVKERSVYTLKPVHICTLLVLLQTSILTAVILQVSALHTPLERQTFYLTSRTYQASIVITIT